MSAQDRDNTGKTETPIAPLAPSGSASAPVDERHQNRSVISDIRNCFIEVLHRDDDPSIWIVRCWKKSFWFKKRVSSDWFINMQQAFAYADEMKREYVLFKQIKRNKSDD